MQRLSIKFPRLLYFLVLGLLALTACEKENNDPPVIDSVRLLDSTARDSTFSEALPGTLLVIQGRNFNDVQAVYFNNTAAALNVALGNSEYIIVAIPAEAPTEVLDPEVPNQLRVVTLHGEATYDFVLTVPPPVLRSASNENALPGSTITISGSNFYLLDKLVFPGDIEVTDFTVNDAATMITVKVPDDLTESGPIEAVNKFGTGTSIFLFNDQTTGVISNFDDLNRMEWGCDIASGSDFPNGHGSYARMTFSNIPPEDQSWWNGGRSINTLQTTWIPSGHISDPLASYALKFEIYVKQEWSAGAIYIVKDYDWTYLARYIPWQATGSFKSTDWSTVSIPLTLFKTDNGAGSPASSLATLVGSGSGSIHFMFVNTSTEATVESFDAAVDNIRIVKIQ